MGWDKLVSMLSSVDISDIPTQYIYVFYITTEPLLLLLIMLVTGMIITDNDNAQFFNVLQKFCHVANILPLKE